MAEAILPDRTTEELFGGFISLAGGAVAGAVASNGVEAFQSETGRVDVNVATVAAGNIAMGVELFANGCGALCVGLDRTSAGWGRIGRRAQQLAEDKVPARNGRGVGAVGSFKLNKVQVKAQAKTYRTGAVEKKLPKTMKTVKKILAGKTTTKKKTVTKKTKKTVPKPSAGAKKAKAAPKKAPTPAAAKKAKAPAKKAAAAKKPAPAKKQAKKAAPAASAKKAKK